MKHLDHSTSILKKAIRFAVLFLLLAADRCIGAAWEGTDDFSSGISVTNWTDYGEYVGQMTVAGTNGHASFIVPVNTEQNAFIVWRGTPTAAEDWAVDITGHNSAFHPSCQLQLAVVNTEAWHSGAVDGFVVSMANYSSGDGRFGTSWWHYPGGYTGRARVGTTTTDFQLRLVYRAASQTVEAWYEPTGSDRGWTQLDSMTLNEITGANACGPRQLPMRTCWPPASLRPSLVGYAGRVHASAGDREAVTIMRPKARQRRMISIERSEAGP